MAKVSVSYILDDVDAAVEFFTQLTDLAGVRYLIGNAPAAVDFYTIYFGFNVDLTAGRTRAIVVAVVGLISLIIGGLALARSAGRSGTGSGRAGAILALVLGLIGVFLSVVHLGSSTGFGTGGGRAGAIVALVLGLIGTALGALALARSRRSRSTD